MDHLKAVCSGMGPRTCRTCPFGLKKSSTMTAGSTSATFFADLSSTSLRPQFWSPRTSSWEWRRKVRLKCCSAFSVPQCLPHRCGCDFTLRWGCLWSFFFMGFFKHLHTSVRFVKKKKSICRDVQIWQFVRRVASNAYIFTDAPTTSIYRNPKCCCRDIKDVKGVTSYKPRQH